MSRPITPLAGLARQAPTASLPALGAPGNKPPHTLPPPPPQTQREPSSARATHTGTAVSPSQVCHCGVQGLSAARHALSPRQPGAPNPIEFRRDGCADRGPGRPGEPLTQTRPNPRWTPHAAGFRVQNCTAVPPMLVPFVANFFNHLSSKIFSFMACFPCSSKFFSRFRIKIFFTDFLSNCSTDCPSCLQPFASSCEGLFNRMFAVERRYMQCANVDYLSLNQPSSSDVFAHTLAHGHQRVASVFFLSVLVLMVYAVLYSLNHTTSSLWTKPLVQRGLQPATSIASKRTSTGPSHTYGAPFQEEVSAHP